jgi:hypothetical protein
MTLALSMASASQSRDPDFVDRRRTFHRHLLEWCLDRADSCLQPGNDEAAARWLLVAARSANTLGCGALAAPRLERTALFIAARLGQAAAPASPRSTRQCWLHVMSAAYPIGGHTAMLRRWIATDDSGDEHHLVLTFMDELAIPDLTAAVERRGGTVTLLGHEPSLLERARRLREIARRTADRVVIHSHMWDVVPTIAFGVAGGPPILFLNHADHTFWVGAAIADLLINLRQAGTDLAEAHRGVDRNFLFRIPLTDPIDALRAAETRAEMRAQLNIAPSAIVFLTVGSAYKYRAMGDLDFPAMAEKLLTELPNACLIAIGPRAHDEGWRDAVVELAPRLMLLGEQPFATRYHPAADIYLEGFPFDSHTALLEAAVSGLPVVRIPASAIAPFSGHHFPLSTVQQPADVADYVRQAVELARSGELRRSTAAKLHDAVVALQCGDGWRTRLAELKDRAPDTHAIHQVRTTDNDREFDRFWTLFQMRRQAVDPLQFTLREVLRWQLDPRDALRSIRAAYLADLGSQGATVRAQNILFDRLFKLKLGRFRRLAQWCEERWALSESLSPRAPTYTATHHDPP